jgi:hypothetical protein
MVRKFDITLHRLHFTFKRFFPHSQAGELEIIPEKKDTTSGTENSANSKIPAVNSSLSIAEWK